MRKNQIVFWLESVLHLYAFHFFFILHLLFPFSFFSPFPVFLQQWLSYYWVSFLLKNVWESIFLMGNFTMGSLSVVEGNFAPSFSLKILSIFMYCISQAPLSKPLWSGYHWKAGFSQKWGKISSSWWKLLSLQSWPQKMYAVIFLPRCQCTRV